MVTGSQKRELRQRFMAKAEAVYNLAVERGLAIEDINLSQIEEMVNELKFELTGSLVEDIIQVQASQRAGPGPKSGL